MSYLGTKPSNQTPTYKLKSEFVATAGQTVFAPSAYTPGYIDVYRNGVKLGNADFTATNGTTVTLAQGTTSGDLITFESVYLASIQNGIPATAGAVSTSLIADNAITAAKMAAGGAWAPAGTVLQVVQSTYSTPTTQTTASGTYTDTGLAATITPKFSTSKVVVLVNQNFYLYSSSATTPYGSIKLLRGSSDIYVPSRLSLVNGGSVVEYGSYMNLSYIDSPSTTSPVTYKTQQQFGQGYGTTQLFVTQRDNSVSSLILMEIAG